MVAHEQTQALMAGQENDLRQVLAQSGITLTGFDVSRNGRYLFSKLEYSDGLADRLAARWREPREGVCADVTR